MLGNLVHDLQRSEEGRLRRFFLRRLRNAADAADATQETFLRLLSSAPNGPIENPHAYLRRTAGNIAYDPTGIVATLLAGPFVLSLLRRARR